MTEEKLEDESALMGQSPVYSAPPSVLSDDTGEPDESSDAQVKRIRSLFGLSEDGGYDAELNARVSGYLDGTASGRHAALGDASNPAWSRDDRERWAELTEKVGRTDLAKFKEKHTRG